MTNQPSFKIGNNVKVPAYYGLNINGNVGVCVAINYEEVIVDFGIHGRVRVPKAYVEEVRAA